MRPVYYVKRRCRQKRKFPKFLLFLIILLIIIYLLTRNLITKPESKDISRERENEKSISENIFSYPTLPPTSPTPVNTALPSLLLKQAVQSALEGTRGSYGIVVKNLKTGENYSLNEHTNYSSASLYKLWVMAEAYRQIRDGLLKETEILSNSYETLNSKFDIDPETAEFKEGTITLSVKDALDKMITISDNYAALLLSLRVKLINVTFFLQTNGFSESAIGTNGKPPTTTAYDTALFFEKLYNEQLISNEYSNKMLETLKAQKLNDKIPKNLPVNTLVAHKTGELDEYTHDAGIVYAEDNEYIIIVLSKSDNPDLADNRISNVSESVYNYFLNNNQKFE